MTKRVKIKRLHIDYAEPEMTMKTTNPTHMKKLFFIVLSMVIFLAPISIWSYIKIQLTRNIFPYLTTWNDSHTCYINSYIPNYSSFGITGKLVGLFSSEAFFRVYDKENNLLKTSEWQFFQRAFADTESERWINSHALYPTDNGYKGWKLTECN